MSMRLFAEYSINQIFLLPALAAKHIMGFQQKQSLCIMEVIKATGFPTNVLLHQYIIEIFNYILFFVQDTSSTQYTVFPS